MELGVLLFLEQLRTASGGIFDGMMLKMSVLGESVFSFLLFAFIYWCVNKRAGQYIGLNLGFSCAANQILKRVFSVPRPWLRWPEQVHPVEGALAGAGGHSFPSGHTARAIGSWGALGAASFRKGMRDKGHDGAYGRSFGILCWIVVFLIMLSRVWLGVHTVTDLAGALASGIFFLVFMEMLLRFVERGDAESSTGFSNRDILVTAAGSVLLFLPMLKYGCFSNVGTGIGLLTGWLAERRLVRFRTEGTILQKAFRFVAGIIGWNLLYYFGPLWFGLFLETKEAQVLSNCVCGFYLMAAYPYLFHALETADRKRTQIAFAAVALAVLVALTGVLAGRRTNNMTETILETSAAEAAAETSLAAETAASETPAAAPPEQPATAETAAEPLQIIAHRGYSGVYPENTLSAFQGAADIRADYFELDVQRTKDGEIVVFHDDTLNRITGREGTIADYSYDELLSMDFGAWFSPAFAGEKIPKLSEALQIAADRGLKVYLELKDIGEAPGFPTAVAETAKAQGMAEQCLFACFNYGYLSEIREYDPSLKLLYNTTSPDLSMPENAPADYYGLWVESASPGLIAKIHERGSKAFIWTANTPQQMLSLRDMGADGLTTNEPGLCRIVTDPAYQYLADHYERTIPLPGLYEKDADKLYANYVVQGLAKADSLLVISAYSKDERENSILFLLNEEGTLLRTVDLGFRAHTGGIACDSKDDLLWITGPDGHVYAVRWSRVRDGLYQGTPDEICADFDAELKNHEGSPVASFLGYDTGKLYVGSYVTGASGTLRTYEITGGGSISLIREAAIPENIQGVTVRSRQGSGRELILTQSRQTDDSRLLIFAEDDAAHADYSPDRALQTAVLPEGAEQPLSTADGLYLLFESAAPPYKDSARIRNDRIWQLRD